MLDQGYCYQLCFCVKKLEKVQWKSTKMAISGIFPAFSAGKKFFLKIKLNHVLSIINTHLCAKNQKKLMMKSRKNAKKLVFPAYFRYFRPEKIFSEIGLRHFLGITILHKCAKFHEKIKYSSRNSRNTVFSAKIGCSSDF